MTLLRPQSRARQGAGDGGASERWSWPEKLDALVAAPRHHRLLFENERVRVLDTRIAPGDTVPVHTHRWPAVHQVMSWSDFVRRDADGKVTADTRGRPAPAQLPAAMWGEALPPHTLENVGSAELHVVSIELKDAPAHFLVKPNSASPNH